MKSSFFYLSIIFFNFFYLSLFAQLELPKYDSVDFIIKHKGYTLSYNSNYKQANWVAYLLTREEVVNRFKRGDFFAPDPFIPGTDFTFDYLKSGYDRGHLAPAADMAFSYETMLESFYYSNMSPQLPRFNRGSWKKLEIQARQWATEYDSLYIVTGPIFEANASKLKFIGKNKIVVPTSFFKVFLQKRNGIWNAYGVILPNSNSKLTFSLYQFSIDEIEKITGFDFFYLFPDPIELVFEAKKFSF
jgi:endonuclease G